MAFTQAWEIDGVTVGTGELSIISGTTTLQSNTSPGFYQLCLDPAGAALAKGDYFKWRIREKVLSGSTQRVVFSGILSQAHTNNVIVPGLILMHGFDFTLQKLAGTDRAWDATVRKSAGASISQSHSLSAVTIGATEWSVTTNTSFVADADTTAGAFQLFVDPIAAPMVKGDDYTVKLYEKVEATGGTQRMVWSETIRDVQSELYVTSVVGLMNGWDFTLKKNAGTDHAQDASVRKLG